MSLTQISVIAVIKLPLHDSKIKRFWSLASPPDTGTTTLPDPERVPGFYHDKTQDEDWLREYGLIPIECQTIGAPIKCIFQVLRWLERDPPWNVSATPVGGNLVFDLCSFQISFGTNRSQYVWKGQISGPVSFHYFKITSILY